MNYVVLMTNASGEISAIGNSEGRSFVSTKAAEVWRDTLQNLYVDCKVRTIDLESCETFEKVK